MSSINNSINISAFYSTEASFEEELLELEMEREQFSLLFEECLLAQSIEIQAIEEVKPIQEKCKFIRSLKQQKKSKLHKLKKQSKKRMQSISETNSIFKYCVNVCGEWQQGGQDEEEIQEQPTIPQQDCPRNQEMLITNIQKQNNCQISESQVMNALDIPSSSKLSLQI